MIIEQKIIFHNKICLWGIDHFKMVLFKAQKAQEETELFSKFLKEFKIESLFREGAIIIDN